MSRRIQGKIQERNEVDQGQIMLGEVLTDAVVDRSTFNKWITKLKKTIDDIDKTKTKIKTKADAG